MAGKPSQALLALTSAAMALPGMAAEAESGEFDYQASFYRESDLPQDKLAGGGDGQRMVIDSHAFALSVAATDNVTVSATVDYESMTGASPWFVQPDADGNPVQIMSGATIAEERLDMLGRVRVQARETFAWNASFGYSDEDDYDALNAGAGVEWATGPHDQTTLSLEVGVSDDQLSPSEGGTTRFPMRPTDESRDSQSIAVGVAQILDRNTVASVSYRYSRHSGFLSDPYKEAFVAGQRVQDNRPDSRNRQSIGLRLRRFFNRPDAALHVDYRFYSDDWKVISHTFEVNWFQNLFSHFRARIGARYYSQSRAFFYQPFFIAARNDGLASSDYRLSQHAAISANIGLDYQLRADLQLRAGVEVYRSDTSYTLESADSEAPGLVDFAIYNLGLSKTFGK